MNCCRFLSLILTLAMVLLLRTSCGQAESSGEIRSETVDSSQWKTMEDVFPFKETGDYQEAYSEAKYVVVFTADGVYYRAVAELSEDVSKTLWTIDFEDEDRDQKIKDLIGPLDIASLDNLSEQMPSQEELNKLVGKTGQELIDDGRTYWYYNLEDMQAGMYYGYYQYAVRFAYDGEPMVNNDDFDFYASFKDLPVKSVTCEGVGDAAGLE